MGSVVEAKAARSVLIGDSSFNEGGLRAAEEIIHAPDHRGPAAECAGAQL